MEERDTPSVLDLGVANNKPTEIESNRKQGDLRVRPQTRAGLMDVTQPVERQNLPSHPTGAYDIVRKKPFEVP
jgi:hypothetical protein